MRIILNKSFVINQADLLPQSRIMDEEIEKISVKLEKKYF
jgi:hypothetical protein